MSGEENQKTSEGEQTPAAPGAVTQEELKQRDEQIAQLTKELAGLKNKEFNFKRLRDMTEIEKEQLSGREKDIMARQEKLEEEQTTFRERVIAQNKNDVFAVLAGNDDELLKQIEFHYARLPEEAVTKDEIAKKAKDAYLLANSGRGSSGASEQLARVMGSYTPPNATRQNEGYTESQLALAKAFGITDEELKKNK